MSDIYSNIIGDSSTLDTDWMPVTAPDPRVGRFVTMDRQSIMDDLNLALNASNSVIDTLSDSGGDWDHPQRDEIDFCIEQMGNIRAHIADMIHLQNIRKEGDEV